MATRKFTIPASTTPTEVTVEATAIPGTLTLVGNTISQGDPLVIIGSPTITPGNPVPPPTGAKLFADINFNDGLIKGFGNQEGNKPAQTVVTDPANASNKVLKITVNSTSRDGDRIRNENTIWNLEKNGQKAAYRADVFIHKDFKSDQNANNFIQIHNAGGNGVPGIAGAIPNVAFMLKGKQLDLNLAWAVSKTATRHDAGDIHKFFDATDWFGRWVKIAFECNYVQTSAGYFVLYIDGVQRYRYNGPMGYAPDVLGQYLKIGLHYPGGSLPAGSSDTSQNILYDNIKATYAGGVINDVI